MLSSDDVVRAACFGIDCSFNDVNKIDAIVEKLYRDAKLQKAAASDNDEDDYGEKEEPEMDSELEEMVEQQFLTKYGLRENLVAILKEEGRKSRANDYDDDDEEIPEKEGSLQEKRQGTRNHRHFVRRRRIRRLRD